MSTGRPLHMVSTLVLLVLASAGCLGSPSSQYEVGYDDGYDQGYDDAVSGIGYIGDIYSDEEEAADPYAAGYDAGYEDGYAAGGSGDDMSGEDGTTTLDPDGEWWVDVHINSCYSADGGNAISVVDGEFQKTLLFTYDEGTQHQEVSIEGSFSTTGNTRALRVEGNLWVEGDSCNGGNGYSGFVEGDPLTGTANSNWGSITFTKQ